MLLHHVNGLTSDFVTFSDGNVPTFSSIKVGFEAKHFSLLYERGNNCQEAACDILSSLTVCAKTHSGCVSEGRYGGKKLKH